MYDVELSVSCFPKQILLSNNISVGTNMEYIEENNKLFRVLDNGVKQQLGWVTDNGRGDALAVNISPIKKEWIEDCKKQGIPSYKKDEPIPFWNNEEDIKRAFDEFYETLDSKL